MNIYAVYTDSRKKDTKPVIVAQNPSFLAGIFGILWMLYYRMWLPALLLLVISFVMGYLKEINLYYYYDISIFFLMTFFASDLRNAYLLKKGYQLYDIIAANDLEEAELRYYTKITELEL
ncbi:MAG: DUF2628 domain-containing protein [Rickettsiaceae bacterium]|nr:DUF2628 domain-containing protein [Rickettsiaceae bacterium]